MSDTKAHGTGRRGFARWLVNPVTTAVLLAGLVTDAALLPTHPLDGGVSAAGRVVGTLLCRPQRSISPIIHDTLVVKERGGIRVLQPNVESWDEATSLIASRPADVAILVYAPRLMRRGFWSMTREEFSHEIRFVSGGSGLTDADRLSARGAMLDAVFGEAAQRSDVLVRLRTEDFAGTRVLWSGVVHNALTFGVLVLFAVSLRWVPAAVAAARARRREGALSRGECPRCGYAIAGLDVCPECGTVVKEKDPGAGPGS